MNHKILTSFEVLGQPVAPGIPDVPYVQQGFFLQVSNLESKKIDVSLVFKGTPGFVASKGAVKLFTNIIDPAGAATQYPTATFLAAAVGFKAHAVPAGATCLFGVQYLLLPPPPPTLTAATGGTPQDSVEARGFLEFGASAGSKVLLLATIRQVFYNYSAAGVLLDAAEGAYSVPLVGGPEHSF